jgi:hypothetical protein
MQKVISHDNGFGDFTQIPGNMKGLESIPLNSIQKTSLNYTRNMSTHGNKRKKANNEANNGQSSFHSMDNFIQTRTVIQSDDDSNEEYEDSRNSLQRLGETLNEKPILDELNSTAPNHLLTSITNNVDETFPNKAPLDSGDFSRKKITSKDRVVYSHHSPMESIGSDIINTKLEKIKDEFGNSYDIKDNYFEGQYHDIKSRLNEDANDIGKSNRNGFLSNEGVNEPVNIELLSDKEIHKKEKFTPPKHAVNAVPDAEDSFASDNQAKRNRNTTDTRITEYFGLGTPGNVTANMIESRFILARDRRTTEELQRQYFQRKLDNINQEYEDPLNSRKNIEKKVSSYSNKIRSIPIKELSIEEQVTRLNFPVKSKVGEGANAIISQYYKNKYNLTDRRENTKSQHAVRREDTKSNRKNFSREPFIKLRIDRIESLYKQIELTPHKKF